jgi:hypothetical protein
VTKEEVLEMIILGRSPHGLAARGGTEAAA